MYNPKTTEPKWQKFWQEHDTFRTLSPAEAGTKPKKYVLSMFPYPSGEGLHVGHAKVYSATDAYARYCKTRGYNVLHPMGWDAFGLPAENYAIKTGTHPAVTTAKNVANYTRQMKSLGLSYDWNREINTTDVDYIKQTQWIFLQLFERGLAYEQDLPINYCPSCKTGLANEEVVGDNICDRCGTTVERRKIRQWVLKITEYAERLLADIDTLDWPESIKEMQRNWIGKSEGVEFSMKKVGDATKKLAVYTTRIDTVYGMTYVVLAADHSDVDNWITSEQKAKCEAYIAESKAKSDLERTNEGKEKTGEFTGSYVVNPFNGEEIPVWIGDYVLGSYGTGAVMAVPAHDERDFEFAKKMNLPIKQVVARYKVLEWEEAPRSDFSTREKHCATIIIEHPTEQRYAVMAWSNGRRTFVGGGIEDGEKSEDAAKREVSEEAGCTDFASVQYVTSIVGHGFKARKSMNCCDPDDVFHIKLASLQNFVETHHEDGISYQIEWKSIEEIQQDTIFSAHHRMMLDIYLQEEGAFTEDGILLNSQEFNMTTSAEARQKLAEKAEQEGFGKKKTNYKLRDWLFSRQRYWGEPIPLIHLSSDRVNNLPEMTVTDGKWPKEIVSNKIVSNKMQFRKEGDGLCYIPKVTGEAFVLNCEGISDGQKRGKYLMIVTSKTGNDFEAEIISKIYDGLYGKIICDYQLPLELPEVANYEPAGDGNSPLALVPGFVNVELASNLMGKRETNTMPQWAGSCWYYLRFMDPKYPDAPARAEMIDYWGQVDKYVGGAEHAVLHLLYARFWHKVLFDIGVVSFKEPFQDLIGVGLILGPDGAKMSKSKGNVINPDDVVKEYGADTLRMYELFLSDFRDAAPWDTDAIVGVRRFLDRAQTIFETPRFASDDMKAMKLLHKTIKKVGEDIEAFKFNTAISALMILLNEGLPKDSESQAEWKESFAILLHPFAPHLAEELWSMLGKTISVFEASWPEYQDFMLVDDEVTIAVQINGKLRGTFTFLNGVAQEEVAARAMEDPSIAKWLEGMTIVREIFVPNKLYGIVAKE